MKKQIKDLRINDIVYQQDGYSEVTEHTVSSIGVAELKLNSGYVFEMDPGDHARWTFKAYKYSENTFYTERLDALKARRKSLDSQLESLFQNQQNFLNTIKSATLKIREVDEIIAKELKN